MDGNPIDTICSRFTKEFPDAPVFSIHDGLATTTAVTGHLKELMEEELNRHIKLPVTLKREDWLPENACKKD